MSSTLEAPKKPRASRTVALHEIARHHSGNGKLIKGKLHSEPADGLYPAFSASGQDVWHTEYGYEGDAIIVSAVGARCGKCFIAQGRWSAIANTHVVWPDPERVELKYLWYLLNDEQFWIRSGSAQPFVSTKKTFEKEIPLPPLDKQRAIVAEIEKQFTRLEAGVGALKRVQANLKRYRAAVLKVACEGKLVPTEAELAKKKPKTGNLKPEFETGEQLLQRILTERRANWTGRGKYKEPAAPNTTDLPSLPEGWVWCMSDAVFSFITSGSRGWAAYYSDTGSIFLRIGNLEHEDIRLDLQDIQYVDPPKGAEGTRTVVQPNDVLISITADVGMVGLVPNGIGEAYINQHVALARPLSCVNPAYIAHYLSASEGGWGRLKKLQRGATKVGLGLDDIRAVPVPLPPLSEQKRIVEEVERRLGVIDEMEATVSAKLQRATRLRQSILQKAFSAS